MKNQRPFRLYGIFGYPLAHTLSPAMHEAAFRDLGIKAFYLALRFDRRHFQSLLRRLSDLCLEGFNVTVPYKEDVMRYMDRLTPEAKAIGAVNTVYKKGRKWIGTNTDVTGFLKSLKQDGGFSPRGKKILVLGAGGSSRAVVYGLARSGASQITIVNRNLSRAKKLIRDFRPLFKKVKWGIAALRDNHLKEKIQSAQLVVNTTSVGLNPRNKSPLASKLIPKASSKRRLLFFDLIYHPVPTPLLKMAKQKGHRTLSGGGMLVHQGAHAFRIWTHKSPSVFVMKRAFNQALQASHG